MYSDGSLHPSCGLHVLKMFWDSNFNVCGVYFNRVLGSCRIPLEAVYIEGSIPTTVYSVVKYEEYRGEIKVGLTFTPEVTISHSHSHPCSKLDLKNVIH